MIQEPTQPQFLSPQVYEKPVVVNTDRVTVTELKTISPNTIPIVIQPRSNQRILLITSPACRSQEQSQIHRNQSKSRITSVPFLPRSEPITLLVKKNLPIKKNLKSSVNYTPPRSSHLNIQNTHTVNQSQTVVNTLTDTDYRCARCNSNSSRNMLNTVLPEQPMTLASMAGIQLTGADVSLPDMSGAMPPTATVEEINVPVFIDEYLQQSTPTSTTIPILSSTPTTTTTTTTTVPAAATIIFNNQSKGINGSEYEEIYIGGDDDDDDDIGTFENFDFDIDMIADCYNSNRNSNNSSSSSSNNNNNNYNIKEQIYYNNNDDVDNSNGNIMISYSSDNINNNNNNNYKSGAKCVKMEPFERKEVEVEGEEHLDQLFHVAPGVGDEVFFSEDTFSNNMNPMDMDTYWNEDAVDISQQISMSDIFTSSQNNPMLCETISTNNSQNIVTSAEPLLPNYDEEDDFKMDTTCTKLITESQCQDFFYDDIKPDLDMSNCTEEENNEEQEEEDNIENKYTNINAQNSLLVVRCGLRSSATSNTMAEKRRKLHLDTSKRYTPSTTAQDINTPDVVNLIHEMSNDMHNDISSMPISKDTIDIMSQLLNCSNSSFQSVDTTIYTALINGTSADDEVVQQEQELDDEDEEAPCTPHSYTSSHTNHTSSHTAYTTSPFSPALSSISANTSSENKRKRGRPSKNHSDKPDPAKLRHLSESERKRLEDRAKNNEASRLSRRKNKEREEAEIEEEQTLVRDNMQLKSEYEHLQWMTRKFKRALRRKHFTEH